MALSGQVEESLREAQECLRNALSFSARTEKTYISKHIADILHQIDNLCDVSEMLEYMDNLRNETD